MDDTTRTAHRSPCLAGLGAAIVERRRPAVAPVLGLGLLAVTLTLVACSGTPTPPPGRTSPEVLRDPATQNAQIQADLAALRGHVETYLERYGELPTRLPVLRDTPDGVPIIETLPRDPWSVPYLIRRLQDDVEISTSGPDLIIGSDDDVVLRVGYVAGSGKREGEGEQPAL